MESNNEIQENKELILTQSYSIKVYRYTDGSTSMSRQNDGFNPLELLGVLDFTQMEIKDQIKGKITPDYVKREVVTD